MSYQTPEKAVVYDYSSVPLCYICINGLDRRRSIHQTPGPLFTKRYDVLPLNLKSLEAETLDVVMVVSLWTLTSISATVEKSKPEFRDFEFHYILR